MEVIEKREWSKGLRGEKRKEERESERERGIKMCEREEIVKRDGTNSERVRVREREGEREREREHDRGHGRGQTQPFDRD